MKVVELTDEELTALGVVTVSPWSVAYSLYPEDDEERINRLAANLITLRSKVAKAMGITDEGR